VLNAQVKDNLEIQKVDFIIDSKLFTSLKSPPFFISWQAIPGKHILVVRAYDLAGNESENSVIFEVK